MTGNIRADRLVKLAATEGQLVWAAQIGRTFTTFESAICNLKALPPDRWALYPSYSPPLSTSGAQQPLSKVNKPKHSN
ncbi:hypothetical protein PybrP1_005400 [[Pythium] brassicae (nom. inval.)]|nr:hypothetical protein PybrP1_005400 [[Pythium] brassicae (nom. inval.)]